MRKGSMKKKHHHQQQHHRMLKEKAKNRVDDLQSMLADLQSARREGRAADITLLEEQVHQMLREWKAELNEPSPANSAASLLENSHGSSDLSSYIRRMLQLNEEEDDATSKLADLPQTQTQAAAMAAAAAFAPNLKPEPLDTPDKDMRTATLTEQHFATPEIPELGFLGSDQYKVETIGVQQHSALSSMEGPTNFEYQQFSLHPDVSQSLFLGFNAAPQNGLDLAPAISELIPAISPPPAAFLRPKCALWDCPRPARGSDWYEDYCSNFHAILAVNEGPPGMSPVLRPGGIDLKDGPLFAALAAKTQGKNVGIPECEGAATTKSPWNAPELFDLLVMNGESLREWLFFDKPRRAFESGNRKQRSLPDYSGRGWHESRKQVMKEYGGLKRSYYMDPQPLSHFEWHLFEYEINNCDACALYRLELKLVDSKKSAKGKITNDSLLDLQNQMGRLNAESTMENKRYSKGRGKLGQKNAANNDLLASGILKQMEDGQKLYFTVNQQASECENVVYGPSLPYGYSIDNINGYYGT